MVAGAGPRALLVADEPGRLRALYGYGILDTAAEEAFDDLADLAAFVCATPMSLVSLTDSHRQWNKSRRGIDLAEMPREMSFCTHAAADVLVVPDLTRDPRFCDNALVTGDQGLRFYAGAPLVTEHGFVLGALCVLDRVPRTLTEDQVAHLRRLAGQVLSQLELRRQAHLLIEEVAARTVAVAELRVSEQRFRSLFDHSPIGIALSDEQARFVEVNPAFADVLGVPVADVLGRTAMAFVHPDDAPLVAASEQGQRDSLDGVLRMDLRLRSLERMVWASTLVTPVVGPSGEQWTLGMIQDVTERKARDASLLDSQRDLRAVATVTRAALSGADPRPLIVAAVRSLSGASTVALAESVDAQTVEVTASAGIDAVGTRVPRSSASRVSQVFSDGHAVFAPDVNDQPMNNPALLSPPETVSALWQPVMVGRTVLGVIVVTWRHRIDVLSERAVRAVQLLADEAALCLHAAEIRAKLERSAVTDPLTGILNRRAFTDTVLQLGDEARVSGRPLSIALVDMDYFKSYNDSFGHSAGDSLLRSFTAIARRRLRKADVFARWGGEEFIVALPDCAPDAAAVILSRVRGSVPAGQSCSVGHTLWNPAETVDTAIARADAALYEAKSQGRDRSVQR
ncbi:MAG: diguanylate cyclase [Geodermatophilaceae bacterium]|nr:diguanylate cyclase [Geodermatophilaceae bacterium]